MPDHSTENGVGELNDNDELSKDKPSRDKPSKDKPSEDKPSEDKPSEDKPRHVAQDAQAPGNDLPEQPPEEHGGQSGLEPTRYGDWEKKGRCTDF